MFRGCSELASGRRDRIFGVLAAAVAPIDSSGRGECVGVGEGVRACMQARPGWGCAHTVVGLGRGRVGPSVRLTGKRRFHRAPTAASTWEPLYHTALDPDPILRLFPLLCGGGRTTFHTGPLSEMCTTTCD